MANNVKVDNLVHVAHGVQIGENSLVIAHAIIGGSCKIGKIVGLPPNASIINKIEIGDNVIVGLGAVVLKSVGAKLTVVGNRKNSAKIRMVKLIYICLRWQF